MDVQFYFFRISVQTYVWTETPILKVELCEKIFRCSSSMLHCTLTPFDHTITLIE